MDGRRTAPPRAGLQPGVWYLRASGPRGCRPPTWSERTLPQRAGPARRQTYFGSGRAGGEGGIEVKQDLRIEAKNAQDAQKAVPELLC